MLFAFVASDAVILAVIGIVAMTVKEVLDQRRERLKEEREAAKEERAIARTKELSERVEVIHKSTNSMKDELVAEVRKAGEAKAVAQRAEGVIEGQANPMPEATVKGRAVGSGEGPPQNLDAGEIRELTEVEPPKSDR